MADGITKAPSSKGRAARPDNEALMASMASVTRKAARDGEVTDRSELGAVVSENADGLKAFVRANEAITDGLSALNSEIVAFGNRRLRENIDQSESVLTCKDAEHAFRLQCDFFESATRQYLDQASKVMTIMTEMTWRVWAPFQERTKEALRDLNKDAE